MYRKGHQVSDFFRLKKDLLLIIHRGIWKQRKILLFFKQRALIKCSIGRQKAIVFYLLTWFPHYWVKKLIIVKKKK